MKTRVEGAGEIATSYPIIIEVATPEDGGPGYLNFTTFEIDLFLSHACRGACLRLVKLKSSLRRKGLNF